MKFTLTDGLLWLVLILSIWIWFAKRQIEIPNIQIANITTTSDMDSDGKNDIIDIVEWARSEVKNRTKYKDWYYGWWYPPNHLWVCSDVFRRALKNAGVDIKKLVDNDIRKNTSAYPRVSWKPDPNIDFRRVANLIVFLKRYTDSLTTEIIPWDRENLEQWQPWDIVTFWKPREHIWIISNRRNAYWVPYMIHNWWPVAKEEDILVYRNENISEISWHFRWKYK